MTQKDLKSMVKIHVSSQYVYCYHQGGGLAVFKPIYKLVNKIQF
jgi:hypothetical protein